jgi:hypothetical protein
MARSAYSVNSYTGGAPTAVLTSGIATTDTVFTISSTTSGWNPLGTTGGFNLALNYGAVGEEKVYVPSGTYTWASGAVTLSGVVRGIDNTTPASHPTNSVVAFISTAVDFQEANLLVSQTLGQAATHSGQFVQSTGSGIAFSTIAESNVTGLTTDLATISGIASSALPAAGGTITGNLVVASGLTASGMLTTSGLTVTSGVIATNTDGISINKAGTGPAIANNIDGISIGTVAGYYSNFQAVAIGYEAAVNNYQAVAIGYNAANSNNAFGVAIGYYAAQAGNNYGVAIGYQANQNNSQGYYTTAIGYTTNAIGSGTVAIGTDHTGTGASASGIDHFVLGTPLHSVQIPGTLTVSSGINASSQRIFNVATAVSGNDAVNLTMLNTVSGQAASTASSLATLSGQYYTTSGIVTNQTSYISTISGKQATDETNIASLSGTVATISGAYFPKTGGTISGTVTAASGLVVDTANSGSSAQTLQLYDVTSSGSTYLRALSNGGLQAVNSAFSNNILNVSNSGMISLGQTTLTSGIPTASGISFNSNGYIGDDGNFHITSSNGAIWINADDGSGVQINTQVSGGGGGLTVGGNISSSNISDSGWISAGTLSNGFTTGSLAPAYRKLNGVVYLRGNVTGGTANTTAFTLPAGYTPAQTQAFAVQQYGSTGDVYLTVTSGGAVQPSATSGWLTISFPIG